MDEAESARRLDQRKDSLDSNYQEFATITLNLIKDWREELIRIGTTVFSKFTAFSAIDTHSKKRPWPPFLAHISPR